MPKQAALFLCLAFIFWLFLRDRKQRPMTSLGLWLPLAWVTILGSRPVSYWFDAGVAVDDPSKYLDGSPVDRAVFLALIIAGTAVLAGRKIGWGRIVASNRWLFALLFYCLLSILWSDYSFVSFKRWIKELGNIIMILIMFTETDPVQAMKAVLARLTYIAVPLSVVFIKYFPDIGRYYSNYTWTVHYGGITVNKNTLGSVLIVCGLYLVWDLIETRRADGAAKNRIRTAVNLLLLLILLWLLVAAQSSTALVCFALGGGILYFMRFPFAKRQVRQLGIYGFVIAFLALSAFTFPGIIDFFVAALGKDTTFTGRTELWFELTKMAVSPMLGAGYQSFWLGSRAEHLWDMFAFRPVQAHNGYLETYLNLGWIGLGLLAALIVSTGRRLKRDLVEEQGNTYSILRFSFFTVALASNWTEATFNAQSLIWIMLIISSFAFQRSPETARQSIMITGSRL